jgi:phosphatidylglycerophosphate synthase
MADNPNPSSALARRFADWGLEEEAVDWFIHRVLAHRVVLVLQRTSITPNQVTLLSALAGSFSGLCLWAAVEAPAWLTLAALLLLLSVVLDCADGQLARLSNRVSQLGEVLDGIADLVVMIAVFASAAYFSWRLTQSSAVWLLAIAAGFSTLTQCYLADAAKLRYLRFLADSGPTSRPGMSKNGQEGLPDPKGYISLLLLRFIEFYRSMQGGTLKAPEPQIVAHNCAPSRMRAWRSIGLGTQFFCLYAAMALSLIWPIALIGCFVVFISVGNIIWVALLLTEKHS